MKFWTYHPALAYGLAALLSTLFVLTSPLALLPFFFLLAKKHVLAVCAILLLTLAYLYQCYTFPPSETVVSGYFHISSLRKVHDFGQGYVYRGVLKTPEGRIACSLFQKAHLPANRRYSVQGKVTKQAGPFYRLKAFHLEPDDRSFSLAEMRYQAKKRVQSYIEQHFAHKRAAHFLSGMVTGELEDRILTHEFAALGLSHIMAISGFHFALLTLAFHVLLRLFLPDKLEAGLLMVLLTVYFLFIGNTPSIQRAWVVAMVFLAGQLLERPARPLNSLGIALLAAILLNPLSAATLSFQLSFLATAGILLAYRPLNRLLQLWIPKYPFKDVLEHTLIWQHGYLTATLIREALTVTLAVHLALFPLLAAFFHTLSLNSLLYNLFFPFCAGLALFLFLLGILSGGLLHPVNNWYCSQLLALTESPPILFKSIYFEHISPLLITIYITTLFILTICYNYYYDPACSREERPRGELPF